MGPNLRNVWKRCTYGTFEKISRYELFMCDQGGKIGMDCLRVSLAINNGVQSKKEPILLILYVS